MSRTRAVFATTWILTILLSAGQARAQDTYELERTRAGDLTDRALIYVSQENYGEAVRLFGEADLVFPSDAMLVYSIARCYEEMGDCEQAHEYFVRALAHPRPLREDARQKARSYVLSSACAGDLDADIQQQRAEALELVAEGIDEFLDGDLESSLASFERANDLHPDAETYLRIAQIGYIQGDCAAVQAALLHAVEIGVPAHALDFVGRLGLEMDDCSLQVAEVDERPKDHEDNTDVDESTYEVEVTDPDPDPDPDPDVRETAVVAHSSTGWEIVPWIISGMAVVCLATSAMFYADLTSVQEELDLVAEADRFDSGHARDLRDDLVAGETMVNAFFWSGVGLAGIAALLFVFAYAEDEPEMIRTVLGPDESRAELMITPLFGTSGAGFLVAIGF